MVLLRATADGKSLVPLTTSIIRTGVTLVLVPLHGLGSDQVDKATVLDHGVEAAATLVLQFQKIAQVELSVGDMLFRAYPAALA
jgi:superfamily II DNA helicase RecQ